MSAAATVLAEELGELPGGEPWRGEVLRRAAELQAALRTDDADAVVATTAALVGLGEGSTPAGDDYLVGVLHALVGGVARSGASQRLVMSIARIAEGRTTAVSAAWLSAAARGEASQVWRALLDALAIEDDAAVRGAARAVRATGYTSGAFSLRGFLDTVAA